MVREPSTRQEAGTVPISPGIVTWHGEGDAHWHVVDRNAAEADQPAVLRTFSSRDATRDDARRFLADFATPSL